MHQISPDTNTGDRIPGSHNPNGDENAGRKDQTYSNRLQEKETCQAIDLSRLLGKLKDAKQLGNPTSSPILQVLPEQSPEWLDRLLSPGPSNSTSKRGAGVVARTPHKMLPFVKKKPDMLIETMPPP